MRRDIELWKIRLLYSLPIMNQEKTLDYILKNRCSIARYGDGEFGIMLDNCGIKFQPYSKELSEKLTDVIRCDSLRRDLLICIPETMNDTSKNTEASREFWINWEKKNQKKIVKYIRKNLPKRYRFGDTQITRPYMGCADLGRTKRVFGKLKKIWYKRNILIVEGEKSRLGVGNDLFCQANRIRRILAPAENAFSVYDKIKKIVLEEYKNDEVVLLALGPTATILAADLSKNGVWALDVGHVDIEYEWFLRGAKTKIPIKSKYVNEAVDGDDVKDISDKRYEKEIIKIIK